LNYEASSSPANSGCTEPRFIDKMKIESAKSNPQGASLMTCQQGASYLGLSKATFWEKCRSGEIPHIRISRRCYRVRQNDLEQFLNSRTR
jgi:excisionase family DNA binding protein